VHSYFGARDKGRLMAETKQQQQIQRDRLAVALGERIGDMVFFEDVRQVGQWVFHRFDPHGTEVDCYRLPLAQCAEPWDAIPMVDSPFSPHHPNLPDTIAKLTSEWEAGETHG
jgi:hypothetical protein